MNSSVNEEDRDDAERAAGLYEQTDDELDGSVFNDNGDFRGSDGSDGGDGVEIGNLITERECGVLGASVFGVVPSVWLKSDALLWNDQEAEQWGKAAHPIVAEWLNRLGKENAQLAILVLVTGLIEQRKIMAFRADRAARESPSKSSEEQPAPQSPGVYGPGAGEL